MKTTIEVKGKEMFFIKDLNRVLPYKNTKENSHLKGKNYHTYSYNGLAFTVTEGDSFIADHKAGNVSEIRLSSEEGQLSFISHINKAQAKAVNESLIEEAKTEGMLNYYKTTPWVPSAITSTEEIPA